MPAITTSPTGSTPTPSPRCTGTTAGALTLLVADALAPVTGAAITLLVAIPQHILGLYIGFLAGILLYPATSDILPVDVCNGQAQPRRREAHGHP
jgi:hypothetical protein